MAGSDMLPAARSVFWGSPCCGARPKPSPTTLPTMFRAHIGIGIGPPFARSRHGIATASATSLSIAPRGHGAMRPSLFRYMEDRRPRTASLNHSQGAQEGSPCRSFGAGWRQLVSGRSSKREASAASAAFVRLGHRARAHRPPEGRGDPASLRAVPPRCGDPSQLRQHDSCGVRPAVAQQLPSSGGKHRGSSAPNTCRDGHLWSICPSCRHVEIRLGGPCRLQSKAACAYHKPQRVEL